MPALQIPIERPKFEVPKEAEYIFVKSDTEQPDKLGFAKTLKLFWELVPYTYQLLKGLIMKNWKTTLGAIVAGVATALQAFGIISIPADVQMYIVGVAVFIIGLFAPDAKKNEPVN